MKSFTKLVLILAFSYNVLSLTASLETYNVDLT